MKNLIFTFFTLCLLTSCASLSYDDQLVSLSSDTNQEISKVEVYNRAKAIDDIVTININNLVHETVSIGPQKVATILIDSVDGAKTNSVMLFGLPTGKTIEKNIDVKPEETVFIAIESNEVIQLSSEEWYSKLNKDRELSPTQKVLLVVFSPIIVPVALVSYMVITLADGIVGLW